VKFRGGEWPEEWVRGAIQTYQPATWHEQTMCYYFEIKIKDNLNTLFSIGFTNENFKNDIRPGLDSKTYGYDSDGTFWYECYGRGIHDHGYTMGDTVGAGVNYVTGEIFFTKNEKLVYWTPCNLKTTFYPSLGVTGWMPQKPSMNVEVNFNGPYIFYVSHYMQPSNLKTPK
jgi:hypothetical protein